MVSDEHLTFDERSAFYSSSVTFLLDELHSFFRERPDVVYWSAERSTRSGIFYLGFLGLVYYASYKLSQSIMDRGITKSYPTSEFKSDTTFKDIFGLEKPRAELQEIIDFLRNPQKSFHAALIDNSCLGTIKLVQDSGEVSFCTVLREPVKPS